MPRIRTIKPEFWDSPGTARASLRARLFFIALWNWADDYGVGTANPKQLIGFAFPNDDDVTAADFPRLRTEVAECYDVTFYEVEGRAYFAIPSWDRHQKNERRAQGKHPGPDKAERIILDKHGTSETSHGSSGTGTGEQGNRGTGEEGTGEQPSSSEIASDLDANPRAEVIELCNYLAERVRLNGHAAKVGKLWHRHCRLLLDVDKRSPEQVKGAIDWATSDPFWSANIQSMPKLREKYTTLQAQASRPPSKSRRQQETDALFARAMARAQAADAAEAAGLTIRGEIIA